MSISLIAGPIADKTEVYTVDRMLSFDNPNIQSGSPELGFLGGNEQSPQFKAALREV